MSQSIPLTKESHEALQEELKQLIRVERPKVIQDIAEAHGKKFQRLAKETESVAETFRRFSCKHPELTYNFLDEGLEMHPQKPIHDIILGNTDMCSALTKHFSTMKYKLGLAARVRFGRSRA